MTDSQVDAGTLAADSTPGQGRFLVENKDWAGRARSELDGTWRSRSSWSIFRAALCDYVSVCVFICVLKRCTM